MATLEDLAKRYIKILCTTKDPTLAITRVVDDIKSLKYTKTGLPISEEDKDKLISLMRSEHVNFAKTEGLIKIAESSDELMRLIDAVNKVLKK